MLSSEGPNLHPEQHIVCSSEFPLVDDPTSHPHTHPHTHGPAQSHIPELTLPFIAL